MAKRTGNRRNANWDTGLWISGWRLLAGGENGAWGSGLESGGETVETGVTVDGLTAG